MDTGTSCELTQCTGFVSRLRRPQGQGSVCLGARLWVRPSPLQGSLCHRPDGTGVTRFVNIGVISRPDQGPCTCRSRVGVGSETGVEEEGQGREPDERWTPPRDCPDFGSPQGRTGTPEVDRGPDSLSSRDRTSGTASGVPTVDHTGVRSGSGRRLGSMDRTTDLSLLTLPRRHPEWTPLSLVPRCRGL